MNLNMLTGLTSQLEAATQALNRAQQDKTFAESVLAQQLSAWQASIQPGLNPETYEQQLAALQAQLLALQSKYTDDHPDVIKARNDVAKLKQKIAETNSRERSRGLKNRKKRFPKGEPTQILQLRAQIHQYDQVIKERTQQQEEIQKQIGLYQARVQASPSVEQEYKLLTRDHQVVLDTYNDMVKRRDRIGSRQQFDRRKPKMASTFPRARSGKPAGFSFLPEIASICRWRLRRRPRSRARSYIAFGNSGYVDAIRTRCRGYSPAASSCDDTSHHGESGQSKNPDFHFRILQIQSNNEGIGCANSCCAVWIEREL